ncbi:hypothetical protein KR032_011447 [Drosophila birchii]|nr:hypothetical protein KR032_011447 [Drosophila birchii]
MCQFPKLWLSLILLVVAHSEGFQSYRRNVCRHTALVTYTHEVYKSKQVPYQEHNFWRGWQTKYRTEYGWENEVDYRVETKLSCCQGYKGSVENCQPVCSADCSPNSFCAAPNQCQCNDGYGGADCHPVCPAGCGKNEVCNSPNKCICQKGYERTAPALSCLPVCAEGCVEHSFCAEPAKCECLPGYNASKEGSACQPVCEPACGPNTHCQKPNVCACVEGYQADGQGHCSPVCEPACGNHSQCVRPGVCECEAGYSLESSGCQPVCSSCPEHSSCLRPEVCICDPGYVMKGDRCEPRCTHECPDYARCVAPNKCECYPGYESTEDDDKCRPKCSTGCPNGFCFSPEKCVCNIGHLMGPDETCEPQCSLRCINGRCTEPETCSCNPGYRFKDGSQHECEAICERGCRNGDCVAPEVCLCHQGYQPEGNSSVTSVCQPPYCSTGCGFGVCVAPEECQCLTGYELTAEGCQLMTSSTIETYTDTTDPEAYSDTTTVIDLSSTKIFADLLQRPTWNCTDECLCWVEYDEEGTLNTAKCAKVCVDDQDKPCLNMAHCRCDLESGQLACTEDGDEDYSSEETRYVCKVPKPKDTKAESIVEAIEFLTTTTAAPKWMIVTGWFAGIIVIAAIAVIATRMYRNSTFRRNDELTDEF